MNTTRVVVAGAGITGLAAAFTLREAAAARRAPLELTVVDAAAEAGGHARSISEHGFLVERGPNGFLDRGAETLALIEELNLAPRLIESNAAARRRFILAGGRLRRVPESPPSLIASDAIGWRGKLRLLREPWAAPPPGGDETVFQFAERRLGREAAETFVDTAVAGISAGDSRALSVQSQFPVLPEMERAHGSLLKAMLARRNGSRARLLSLDHGLGAIAATIGARLNGSLRLGTSISSIEKSGAGWRVNVNGAASLDADHVVLALPAHAAAALVGGFDRDLMTPLAAIPYADITMVALAYRAADVARPLDGYGYLVTRAEDLATLGVLWESSVFANRAPAGAVLLRVMLGGARRPEVGAFDDATVAKIATQETAAVLGIAARPMHQWVCRWPAAIAQYTVGHQSRLSAIRQRAQTHRGLHVCGTAYDGVSFNDAIASGRRAARAVVEELAA